MTPRAVEPVGKDGSVQDLVAEFLEEKRRDAEAAAKAARRKKRTWPKIVAGLAAVAVWFVPVPDPMPRGDTSEMTAAGMRMELFIAAQRVRSYRSDHGRLPTSLDSAGVRANWISMRTVGDSVFELTATTNKSSVTYASTMSDSVFFGASRRMLGRGAL